MTKGLVKVHRDPEPHWVGDGFPVRTLFSYVESERSSAHSSCWTTPGPRTSHPRRSRGA